MKLVRENINDYLPAPSEKEIDKNLNSYSPNTALVTSAEKNYLKGVKNAIQRGASIHVNNDAALRYAAEEGNENIVEYLLNKGADPTANNYDSFLGAVEGGHPKTTELILKSIKETIPEEIIEAAYDMVMNNEVKNLLNTYIHE